MNRADASAWSILVSACALCATVGQDAQARPPGGEADVVFSCRSDNDLYQALGAARPRHDNAADAVSAAPPGAGVLILADAYPEKTTTIAPDVFEAARKKKLRLYVEFPSSLPGLEMSDPRSTQWERAVVASDVFGPTLEKLRILAIHDCRFVPVRAERSHIVVARVAGFDRAVYGLTGAEAHPILFEHPQGNVLVATTKLSQFVTARYAPTDAWRAIWPMVLGWLQPGRAAPKLDWTPTVRPSFGRDEKLPDDVERQAIRRGIDWFFDARLLIHPSWRNAYDQDAAKWPDRIGPVPRLDWAVGDGSLGVLEGFSSRIDQAGAQPVRWWRRHDCNGEVAGAMGLAGAALKDDSCRQVAGNIGDFLYVRSILTLGERADPEHPAYGLIGWNDVKRYAGQLDGYGVYYADDNARGLLGMMAAAATRKTDRWDERMLRCLLSNLRLAGQLGFQPNRIDEAPLEKAGWQDYFRSRRTSFHPHYQAYMWACYLWAYRHTGYELFLDRAKTAIGMTMEAYPDQWRWTNGIQQERARMLLPLAWLVRVDDTPQHRAWLRTIADAMLEDQAECGAIREELGPPGRGDYGPPAANAKYGTNEATLIQSNGDPLADLLYTTNFAFLGLHEAAAATGDPRYRQAEDKLAKFLCRIQVQSQAHPELDGAWFRAFEFKRWEYWASNADAGWGAWSVETGWTQAWITGVLAMRQLDTSLWDTTANTKIGRYLSKLRPVMLPDSVLAGESQKPKPAPQRR